jgi:hypothetical protein
MCWHELRLPNVPLTWSKHVYIAYTEHVAPGMSPAISTIASFVAHVRLVEACTLERCCGVAE